MILNTYNVLFIAAILPYFYYILLFFNFGFDETNNMKLSSRILANLLLNWRYVII